MLIIADASPLISLAICDCLHILELVFDEIKVSKAVYDEVTISDKPKAYALENFLKGKVIELNIDNYIIGGSSIDEGELSSIALYKKLNANYLLIDEKAGRRVAKLNNVKIIGSLGVLIEAKRKGILPVIKPHIEALRRSKIHFSDQLLNYALNAVKE